MGHSMHFCVFPARAPYRVSFARWPTSPAGLNDSNRPGSNTTVPFRAPPAHPFPPPASSSFLDHRYFGAFISVLIFWALIGSNVQLALTSAAADFYFEGVTLLLFSAFILEWLAQIVARPGYPWSFFFYLDIVSALSLLFDIPVVRAPPLKPLAWRHRAGGHSVLLLPFDIPGVR